jgi:hypothetical protein
MRKTIRRYFLKKNAMIRIAVCSIIILISATFMLPGCSYFDKHLFSNFKLGPSYAGKGKIHLVYDIPGTGNQNLSETALDWDAVRINQTESDLYFDINSIPVMNRAGKDIKMYLSIKLKIQPYGGTVFISTFLSGPSLELEFYSPSKFQIEAKAESPRLIDKFIIDKGFIRFEKADIRVGGKLTGTFEYHDTRGLVQCDFNLELENAPELLSSERVKRNANFSFERTMRII